MATEVGIGYVSIVPSAKNFGQKLQAEIGNQGTTAGTKVGKDVGDGVSNGMATRKEKLRGVMNDYKGIMLAAAGAALAVFTADSIRAASDQEQAIGSLNAVFKESSEVMRTAAEDGYKLGLSTTDYATAATSLGAQLTNLGVAQSELSPLTQDLVTKAADMAAQFGGTSLEAVDALTSAFRGETDPIERYGVSLNEAQIKAEMAATGQDKLTATLSLLQKQLTNTGTIGAWGREQETTAVKAQILAAQWDNMKVTIGELLIPALNALITAVTPLLNWFNGLSDSTKDWMLKGFGLVAALTAIGWAAGYIKAAFDLLKLADLAKAIWGVAQATWGWAAANIAVILPVAAILLGAAAMAWFAQKSTEAEGVMKRVYELLGRGAAWTTWSTIIDNVVTPAINNFKSAVEGLQRTWDTVWAAIQTTFTTVATAITTAWGTFWSGLRERVDTFVGNVRQVWDGFLSGLRERLDTFVGNVRQIWNDVWSGLRERIDTFTGNVRTLWNTFTTFLSDKVRAAKTAIDTIVRGIATVWNTVTTTIRTVWNSVWTAITSRVTGAVNFIRSAISTLTQPLQTIWGLIQKVATGLSKVPGVSAVASRLGFAAGGLVPGTGNRDSVPAMLTPGEFVANRGMVASAGGPAAMERWRQGGDAPGGGGITVQNLNINNPAPERASDSLPRAIRRMAYVGGVA